MRTRIMALLTVFMMSLVLSIMPVSAAPPTRPSPDHTSCFTCLAPYAQWVMKEVGDTFSRLWQTYQARQDFLNGYPIEFTYNDVNASKFIVSPYRTYGVRSTLHDIRPHGATRFRGWGRGTSENYGGDTAARELFKRLTGRYPYNGLDTGYGVNREVLYRSASNSTSGYPKVEVMDSITKFHEVITFKP